MGRFYYVDNVIGIDADSGLTTESAFLTLDKAIDMVNLYGTPGDTIRIVYTGTDYAFNSGQSYIQAFPAQGDSWEEGHYMTIEGYNKTGGDDRPKLVIPGGTTSGYHIRGYGSINYWWFRELWFYYPVGNTTWSTAGFYMATSIQDGQSYFKFTDCRFEAPPNVGSTNHGKGIFFGGGGKIFVTIKNCFFYEIYRAIEFGTTQPYSVGYDIQNNIYYSTETASYSYCNYGSGIDLKFTYKNNTMIGLGPSQYTGAAMYFKGDITGVGDVVCQNNFCFWSNFFMRGAPGYTANPDNSTYFDYNTWGRLNGGAAGYTEQFDVYETDVANTKAEHDYNLHTTHTKADYTSIFKAHTDFTYRWPDSAWQTIPDLRPTGWEMTGTFEDPINGLRGAIQYSGIYQDTSIFTTNSVDVYNHSRPTYVADIGSVLGSPELLDFDELTGVSLNFAASNGVVMSRFGQIDDYSCNVISITHSSKISVTTKQYGKVLPKVDEDVLVGSVQLWHEGPSDTTIAWGEWEIGNRSQNVTPQVFIAGTYNVYMRYMHPNNGSISSWEKIYTYTV